MDQINKNKEKVIKLTEKSWIKIIPNFYKLTKDEFESIWKLMPNEPSYIFLHGKKVEIPRRQALFDESTYYFSGETVHPRKLEHPILIDILQKVSQIEPNYKYNGVFVNWYRNGNDCINYHSDCEKDLIQGAPIFSLSFGQKRNFKIKNIKNGMTLDFELNDGMLLIMGGDMQKEFQHSVPRSKKNVGKRLNLTFRSFV